MSDSDHATEYELKTATVRNGKVEIPDNAIIVDSGIDAGFTGSTIYVRCLVPKDADSNAGGSA